MASSGTYNFSLTTGQSVISAFRRIGIPTPQLRQEHMVAAREEMNLLFVEWANKQVNLFKVELISVPMINGTAVYTVPDRVVMILDAWITVNQGQNSPSDLYITPVSRTEYASFTNKTTPGRPTCFWFDRLISPTVTMWPVANATGLYTLNYYCCVQMQDANLAGGETPDIPYRWYDAFVAGMAHRLSRSFAPAMEDKRKLDAMEAWTVAATQDTENVALSMAPTISSYYRRS